mgnify:CR=1 FL=1
MQCKINNIYFNQQKKRDSYRHPAKDLTIKLSLMRN